MVKLLVLPYAGGSAASYLRWKPHMAQTVEIVPLDPAGRGRRTGQPFAVNMAEAAQDVLKQALEHIDGRTPYVIYGHSMGALLAYELYHLLLERRAPLPSRLFVSGCRPPHAARNNKGLSYLPDELLKQELVRLGGTPREVLQSKELMDYCLPIIRADFRMLEHYVFREKRELISCDISVFGGQDDDIPRAELEEWGRHTRGRAGVAMFPGDHFFINQAYPQLSRIISERLERLSAPSIEEECPDEQRLEVSVS